jgi:hypothetical protein
VGIIQKELPIKNKYTNLKAIKTINTNKLSLPIQKQLLQFLQLHFLNQSNIHFYPTSLSFLPYLTTFSYPSFLSYYIEPDIYIDQKTGKTITESKLIGLITSKPLIIYINHVNVIFDIYYVDYLCIHKYYRKKNIAPQLIQTHYYQQSHFNKKIAVSLFKREGELTGIIPLTVFKTFCFTININLLSSSKLPNNYTLLTCDSQNLLYFFNLLQNNHGFWDLSIYPEYANIAELIKSNNIIVKMLMDNDRNEICAFFVFKHTATYIDNKDKQVLSCIASYKINKLINDIFISTFLLSIHEIINKNSYYYFINIEDISHNNILITSFKQLINPSSIYPTAYFFYNFAYSPFKSNKVFVLL